jgi:hypothetical protein
VNYSKEITMGAPAARTDPTHNAGLFNGRRPAALPQPVRTPPGTGTGALGRWFDQAVALSILLLEIVLVLSVWGPQPLGWLWIASQVSYLASSVAVGLVVGLTGTILTLALTLGVLTRLDHLWKLARRSAGHQQREGVLERLFVAAAVVFVPAFLVWLFVIEGGGSMLYPANPG